MSELHNWPGSIVATHMYAAAVGRFLRTHRDGGRLPMDWLRSVPADRTEAEYQEERRQAAAEQRRGVRAAIFNSLRRRACIPGGTPLVDASREPLVLSEDPELCNLARFASIHFALRLALPASGRVRARAVGGSGSLSA